MAEGKSGPSWLKIVGLGCLGLVGLLLLAVAVVVGIAWFAVDPGEIESSELNPELAAPAAPGPPSEEFAPVTPPADGDAVGRVVLELSHSEFIVRPAAAGEPLRVKASYDRRDYELHETLDEEPADGGWTYRVSFRRTGTGLIVPLKELLSGKKPKVEIELPRDLRIDLDATISRGALEMELGGLWLRDAQLRFDQGGAVVAVSEPTREATRKVTIEMSMGGLAVRKLGNASPRELSVEYRMGGMALDLGGAWLNDAEIRISGDMGGGQVAVPGDVEIEGIDVAGEIAVELRPEIARPTLRFTTVSSSGELEFVRE